MEGCTEEKDIQYCTVCGDLCSWWLRISIWFVSHFMWSPLLNRDKAVRDVCHRYFHPYRVSSSLVQSSTQDNSKGESKQKTIQHRLALLLKVPGTQSHVLDKLTLTDRWEVRGYHQGTFLQQPPPPSKQLCHLWLSDKTSIRLWKYNFVSVTSVESRFCFPRTNWVLVRKQQFSLFLRKERKHNVSLCKVS